MDTHGGAAGEKLAVLRSHAAGPQGLGLPDRREILIQIPCRRDLCHIQPRQGGQLGAGKKGSLVAGHMEAEGSFCGVSSQGIIERCGHDWSPFRCKKARRE